MRLDAAVTGFERFARITRLRWMETDLGLYGSQSDRESDGTGLGRYGTRMVRELERYGTRTVRDSNGTGIERDGDSKGGGSDGWGIGGDRRSEERGYEETRSGGMGALAETPHH